MAMRNRYGLFQQTVTWGNLGEIRPLGYAEVIPGETIQGTIEVNVFSQPTVRPVSTRVYGDVFAFYVPNRLTWDQWPEWISQARRETTDPNLPLLSDLWADNFEERFCVESNPGVSGYDRNTVWLRRAYNLIYYSFFQDDQRDSGQSMDGTTIQNPLRRPSTIEAMISSAAATRLGGTDIDVSGGTLNTDDLREALAQDRFERVRAWYGDKYTDYLRSLGVRSGWALQEEPELIGKIHADLKFRTVNNTNAAATDPLGAGAGYFHATPRLKVNPTFVPEHGVIAIILVTRTDIAVEEGPVPPVLAKDEVTDYWSPEYAQMKDPSIPAIVFQTGLAASNSNFNVPRWEEYRRGMNMTIEPTSWETAGPVQNTYLFHKAPTGSVANHIRENPADYDDFFTSSWLGANGHMQVTSQWRMFRKSPVVKAGAEVALR